MRQLKDPVVLGCPFHSEVEAGKDNMKIDHERVLALSDEGEQCRPQKICSRRPGGLLEHKVSGNWCHCASEFLLTPPH